MDDKVTKFVPKDAAKNPDHVLAESSGVYESVLVLGWGKDQMLNARASLNLTATDINWLIDVFKAKLINGDYNEHVDETDEGHMP